MKRVLLSVLAIAVVLGIASAALAQAPAAPKTVAVVTLSSFGSLTGDVEQLGKIIGMPGLAEGLAITDENDQPLIDPARPWGLIVQIAGEGEFRQIGFVPVKNFKGFMELATALVQGMAEGEVEVPDDPENGTWKIKLASPEMTLFAKKSGDWAFVTTDSNLLGRLPGDPTRVLGGLDKQYDFGARAIIKNIPKEIRDEALGMLGIFAPMAGDPNTAAALKQSVDQLTATADQLDELVLGLTMDGEKGTIALDLVSTAVAGTKLAEQFAQAAGAKTNFAGFDLPGAAVTANVSATLADADVQQATDRIKEARETALAELRNQGLSDEELELATDLLNDLLDVVQKTIEAKTFDGGVVAMADAGKATIAAGGAITDGAKLEKAIKQLAGIAAEEDEEFAKALKFDVETHKGVRFHVLSMPTPDPETAKLIGETATIVLGIGDKSVYAGAGTDPIGLLKQVIDKSASEPNKETLPFRISVALTPIVNMITSAAGEEAPKEVVDALLNALQGSAGKDHLTITTTPIPNGSRTRIEVEEGVLKVIGVGVQQVGAARGGMPIGPPPGGLPPGGPPPGIGPLR